MISASVRGAIKDRVRAILTEKLAAVQPLPRRATDLRPLEVADPDGLIKPFHQLLFPEGLLRPWEFERSFSTALGSSFEVAARVIGERRFSAAKNGEDFSGSVSPAARSAIDDILRDVRREGMKRSYVDLVNKVVGAYVGGSGSLEKVKVDLYLKDAEGREIFFEMKSPKPNKDQCVGTTEKLLLLHAISRQGPPLVRTYYAMSFNPYGDSHSDYAHGPAKSYLDLSNQVLIGKEFWDFVGGSGAYEEVLSIYQEVGSEMIPEVIRRFGL